MTSSSTSKPKVRRFPGVVSRALAILILLLLLIVLAWAVYALAGMRAVSQTAGTLRLAGLIAPVRIVRDGRDIPHIIAANDHDLMFAQGYAEASDRLFQMDLLRRFVYGRLSEVLGSAVLPADENARVAPIDEIIDAQWARMNAGERGMVQAFSDGVNAAMAREPLPVEFHLLLYKPGPWHPKDSLAVGMATVLDLIDRWDDVIRRDAVANAPNAAPADDLYAITDPAYDAPIDPPRAVQPVAPLPARRHVRRRARAPSLRLDARPPVGSNEWAVGAQRSLTGRALLANDPHLRLGIPGIWYVVDLHAGNLHVAGASLAGTPGVILGHNGNLAWGATNATVTTEVVYRDSLAHAARRVETFHVRFGHEVRFAYYRTKHGFVAETARGVAYAVDWNAVRFPSTPLTAFRRLDYARTIAQALRALRSYPGPPQNFVLADRSGRVSYQLAGLIPRDPLWGLRVHSGADPPYPFVAFAQLPHVSASRTASVFTANNRTYGDGYPLRLSPNFAAPYRAKRIEQLLSTKARFDVADFAAFQNDTLSFPERDIAHAALAAVKRKGLERDPTLRAYLAQLAAWNGRFDPDSRGAPLAWELRSVAVSQLDAYNAGDAAGAYGASADGADLVLLMRVLRDRPRGWWPNSNYGGLLIQALRTAVHTYGTRMLEPWGRYDAVTVKHPLATLGFSFLNGATFAGDGDSFGLHVQTATHSQSFRAVWDVGNWDAGGLVIPSGESGEPASGHYTDLSPAWIAGRLVALPFTDSAVRASARATLTLVPR